MSLGITLEAEGLARDVITGELDSVKHRALCESVLDAFPNLMHQAITLRESHNASHNGWSACIHDRYDFHLSVLYDITHIVDKVGGGDAFSAGLFYGLITGVDVEAMLAFATAASCLRHTIVGDINLATVTEVRNI